MGRGATQEPQCQFIYLFLHGCHNLYFRRNHVTVLLHQNLPQSKDVENILGTICLHDRRHHRRRQLFIYWLSFAETSPMILLPVYLFFLMSILNPMTILKYFLYS